MSRLARLADGAALVFATVIGLWSAVEWAGPRRTSIADWLLALRLESDLYGRML